MQPVGMETCAETWRERGMLLDSSGRKEHVSRVTCPADNNLGFSVHSTGYKKKRNEKKEIEKGSISKQCINP